MFVRFIVKISFIINHHPFPILRRRAEGTRPSQGRHRFEYSAMINTLLSGGVKIKKSCPSFGTRLPSCGTTQVDAEAPARLTYFHTRRPDNGCGPRRPLLGISPFAPPSQVHSPERSLPRFHPSRLSGRQPKPDTPLAHRFSLISSYYTQGLFKCQPSNCTKQSPGRDRRY